MAPGNSGDTTETTSGYFISKPQFWQRPDTTGASNDISMTWSTAPSLATYASASNITTGGTP